MYTIQQKNANVLLRLSDLFSFIILHQIVMKMSLLFWYSCIYEFKGVY